MICLFLLFIGPLYQEIIFEMGSKKKSESFSWLDMLTVYGPALLVQPSRELHIDTLWHPYANVTMHTEHLSWNSRVVSMTRSCLVPSRSPEHSLSDAFILIPKTISDCSCVEVCTFLGWQLTEIRFEFPCLKRHTTVKFPSVTNDVPADSGPL
jgi:hypothetical protein